MLVRRVAGAQVLPLAALTIVSSIGTVLAPALRDAPLLLIMLSPRLPFLVFAAHRCGTVPFLLVATARLCIADPFHFALGRRHGGAAQRMLARSRLVGRLGTAVVPLAVLLRPNGRHLVAAGACGLPARLVALLDVVGTTRYVAAVAGTASFI